MSTTPLSGAQARARLDPANPCISAARLAPIDQLRECLACGLCLIPIHATILDFPEPGAVECGCGNRDCKSTPGKHPRIKWKGVTAPHTFEEVAGWYYSTSPMPVMSNWSVLLGACDPPLAVLDIDTRNGGLESFDALIAKYGPLPNTWRDESSRGGGHYYFAAPPGLPDKAHVTLGPGLDFLAGRHLVIIAPSKHRTGANYRWIVPPWAAPVAALPAFLRDLVRAGAGSKPKATRGTAATPGTTGTRSRRTSVPPPDSVSADEAELIRQALACVQDWPLSIQGRNGSGACFLAACNITQGFGLRGAAAWTVLSEYNRLRCQPMWSDAELQHKLDDAAKGPVTGKLIGTDWVAIREEVSRFDPADVAHLLTGTLDGLPDSPPADSAAPPESHDPDDTDEGGTPVHRPPTPPLPTPAPGHMLTDPAAAARVIRDATRPAPDVVAKADAWSSAHTAGPGVYLDRDPPSDPVAVVRETLTRTRAVRSLTVLQSGRDCTEAAESITSGGPKAAAYPIRTAESCKNLDAVHRAEKLGLAPTAAVCPDCPHNITPYLAIGLTPSEIVAGLDALPELLASHSGDDFDDLPWHSPPRPSVDPEPPPPSTPTTTEDVMLRQCPHLLALDAVQNAPHRVATSTRAAFNFDDVTADAEIVILLDNAEDVLAPHATTGSIRVGDLVRLGRAATEAARKCRRNRQPAEWWDALRATTDAIRAALAERVRATIPRTPAVSAPKLWPATFWAVWGAQRGAEGRMPDQLIRVCAAAASGELRALVFTPGDPVAGDPNGWVSATWCPRVPPDATVIALADASSAALGRAVGRSVIDITSGGPPGWAAHAVQCPIRVTGGSRESGVASRIRGHLAARPGERLAVLLPGNQKHFAALRTKVEDLLVPAERKRVEFAGWYDRGAPVCDRMLALGVPAIPPHSVGRRLEQRDLIAAALADKVWGEVRWRGTRTDGTEQEVVGQGYRHPDWAAAYRDAVLDLLRRKLVRVTVPITVVADLDLGLPLVDEDFAIDGDDLRLLEALKDAPTEPAEGGSGSVISARSKRKSKKKGFLAEMSVSRTDGLAEAAGLSASTVKRRLNALAGAGLVGRVGARGGWTWPGLVVYPDYEPGEGTDAWDTSTPAASGESASLDRLVPESDVAVGDPVPADAHATVPGVSLVPEPAEPEATVELETTPEARWDPELCSLICWFMVADERLTRAPFRLPRPGRPGGFVIADDPPALYSKLRALISAGPGATDANGLARNLRELYAVFGPRPEPQPTAGRPNGAVE